MPALFDTYRFKANDGMGAQSVYPLASGLKQKWERDGDNRSYRIKITTPMVFRGADYDYFRAIYDTGDCTEVTFLIERYCGGVWADWYEGVLPIRDGEYNASRCEVRFEIIPDDVYECANKSFEKKSNWLDYGTPVSIKTFLGTIETYSVTVISPSVLTQMHFAFTILDIRTDPSPDVVTQFRPISSTMLVFPTQTKIITTLAREKITSVLSPGMDWVLISGTTWARPVTISSIGTQGIAKWDAQIVNPQPISNGRTLKAVLEGAVTDTGCPIDSVVSNFFNINPDGSEPTNAVYDFSDINYAQTLFFQKSDIVRASASNDATRFILSLKEFLNEIKIFNLFWAIVNDAGIIKFRIEHYTYFEGVNGLNLVTLGGGKYIVGMDSFKSDAPIPNFESFTYQESYRPDFLVKRITYPPACATVQGDERTANQMSVDVGGLIENPDAGLEGFMLLATYLSGSDYVLNAIGGNGNGAFAWKYVIPKLWADGRFHLDATANVPGYAVTTVRKTRQQGVITIKFPCSQAFEASKLVNTQLGWGEVEDAEEDTERCTLKLNLLQ